MAASDDTVFSRVSVNENGVIPCGRYLFHEINYMCGYLCQVIGSDAEVLHRTLEKNSGGNLKGFSCFPGGAAIVFLIVAFVEQHWSEFHRSNRITDKRMQGCIESFHIIGMLGENQVF
ncbi:hypothetical protein D3C73_996580 [compost metagenome]